MPRPPLVRPSERTTTLRYPLVCAGCGKPDAAMACGACQFEYYCNSSCQRSRWKAHRLFCHARRGVHSEDGPNTLVPSSRTRMPLRSFFVPSVSYLAWFWRRPVLAWQDNDTPTCKLLKLLALTPNGQPQSEVGLQQVVELLDAGADPNASMLLFPRSSDLRQEYCRLRDSAHPGEYGPVPAGAQMCLPAVFRAIAAGDRGLMKVVKEHSTVPLDVVSRTVVYDKRYSEALGWHETWALVEPLGCAVLSTSHSGAGKLECIRMALELGCDTDGASYTQPAPFTDTPLDELLAFPIVYSTTEFTLWGHAQLAVAALRLLVLEGGADVNACCSTGQTFLSYIIHRKRELAEVSTFPFWLLTDILRTALELGAAVHWPDAAPRAPFTALHWVMEDPAKLYQEGQCCGAQYSEFGTERLLTMLKDRGVDMRPEASTVLVPQQATRRASGGPLVYTHTADNYLKRAIMANSVRLVRWILDNCPVNVNAHLDTVQPTYLFVAAAHVHVEIVTMLLVAQADPTVANMDGKTAADAAREAITAEDGGDTAREIVRLLEQAAAQWPAAQAQVQAQAHAQPAVAAGGAAAGGDPR